MSASNQSRTSPVSASEESNTQYCTPIGSGCTTFPPDLAFSHPMGTLNLPPAQSDPPSPFNFPGNLLGFSELVQPAAQVLYSDTGAPYSPTRDVGSGASPVHFPLLFRPHPPVSRVAASPVSQLSPQHMALESWSTSSASRNPVVHDSKTMGDKASIMSQVRSLGEEAVSAYKSQKLFAYEVNLVAILQNPFLLIIPGQLTSGGSRKILQFFDRYEDCDIDASVSHPVRHWLLHPTVAENTGDI